MHQGCGGGSKQVMRTGGTDSRNPGEYGSLDYSAESRNEEKRNKISKPSLL